MRFPIFAILCSLLVFASATDNLEDKSNIEDLLNAFPFIIDAKKYDKLGDIFVPDVTYNPGGGPVQGLSASITAISKIIPKDVVSNTLLSTKLIKFLSPFDKQGRSNRAEALSYNTFVFFGSANLTGQDYILFAKFVDAEIVKTQESGFGGWRFKNRKFELV
ncbi:hypothetical protein MMC31_000888, partial [Peltigera leucophlebia]|nr:hypothetical protein [Peltigera leucophlebia]